MFLGDPPRTNREAAISARCRGKQVDNFEKPFYDKFVMFVLLSSSCLSSLSYRLSAAALAGLDERLR